MSWMEADNSAFSFFTSSTTHFSFTLNEERCVLILDLPIPLMFNAKNQISQRMLGVQNSFPLRAELNGCLLLSNISTEWTSLQSWPPNPTELRILTGAQQRVSPRMGFCWSTCPPQHQQLHWECEWTTRIQFNWKFVFTPNLIVDWVIVMVMGVYSYYSRFPLLKGGEHHPIPMRKGAQQSSTTILVILSSRGSRGGVWRWRNYDRILMLNKRAEIIMVGDTTRIWIWGRRSEDPIHNPTCSINHHQKKLNTKECQPVHDIDIGILLVTNN